MRKTKKEKPMSNLRAELQVLRSRYDSGAVDAGIYEIIRKLETDIAWAEHHSKKVITIDEEVTP